VLDVEDISVRCNSSHKYRYTVAPNRAVSGVQVMEYIEPDAQVVVESGVMNFAIVNVSNSETENEYEPVYDDE
jgi:hypothetical protein